MTRKLFISYAWKDDSPFAEQLYNFLGKLKDNTNKPLFDVWWDKARMTSDIPFSQVIQEAITPCERLLVIAGPAAYASVACNGEWACARKHCIPVIALMRFGDFPDVPESMRAILGVDCRKGRDEGEIWNEIARILAVEPPPLTTPHGAPPLPQAYIERETYLTPLKAAIKTGDPLTLITSKPDATALHGVGGIGKTTLAAALTHDCDVRRTFSHIFWINVGPNRAKADVPSLMYAIGAVFKDSGDNYQDLNTARAMLTAHLRDKKTLIVLDDVWENEIARDFMIGGIDCRIVVTTRLRGLARLLGMNEKPVDRLSDDESLHLIAEHLGVSPEALPSACQTIAQKLAGHTLAVSLAAAWMAERDGVDSAANLLERLNKRAAGESPFHDLQLSASDKNANLELSLSLSYDDLGGGDAIRKAEMQRRFRQLGIFAVEGAFDAPAAGAVWADADPDDADDALALLVRVGLVEKADGRYSLHPLLHAYAHALLTRAGELDDTAARHFAHYADLHGEKRDHTDFDYLQTITIDLENLQIALHWGFDQTVEAACDLLTILGNYLGVYQSTAVYQPLLNKALSAARTASYLQGEADALRAIGNLSVRLDELADARAYYDSALPLYRTIGHRLGEANTLRALGEFSVRLDALADAKAYYDAALPLYRTIGDRLGEANTLQALGDLGSRMSELADAKAYYDDALPLYRAIGERLGEANTLRAIGDLSVRLAELDAAKAYYDEALPLYRAIGHRLGEANTLQALGDLSVRLDDLADAKAYYNDALSLYRTIGNRLGEANTLQALGDLSVRLDDLADAKAYYDDALPLYRTIGDRLGEANTLKVLGDLSLRLDELDAAKGYYDDALPLYRTIGARLGEANTLRRLGELSVRLDAFDEAKSNYEMALNIYEAIGDRPSQGNCWYGLAQVAVAEKKPHEADQFYCRALRIQQELVQVHPSFGRVFTGWQRNHAEMLAQFGIESACAEEFPPPQEDPQAAFVRQIVTLYQQGDAEAVRSALVEAGATEAQIDDLLAQLAAMGGGDADGKG